MYIDWNEDTDRQMFSLARAVRYKEMRKIHFDNLKQEENKKILDYLCNNTPETLNIFAFDANHLVYGSGDFYLEGIEKVDKILTVKYSSKYFTSYSLNYNL